jgi:hypothetical protein
MGGHDDRGPGFVVAGVRALGLRIRRRRGAGALPGPQPPRTDRGLAGLLRQGARRGLRRPALADWRSSAQPNTAEIAIFALSRPVGRHRHQRARRRSVAASDLNSILAAFIVPHETTDGSAQTREER